MKAGMVASTICVPAYHPPNLGLGQDLLVQAATAISRGLIGGSTQPTRRLCIPLGFGETRLFIYRAVELFPALPGCKFVAIIFSIVLLVHKD